MPGIVNEDLLTPSPGSEAVKIIDNLFGVGWQGIFKGATAATDAPNALYTIMATFNLIVLAAVVLFFIYIVGIGVLGTAHEGKPLGSRYNTLWTPIRSAVAVGLLMPLPWAKGLSMLQALLLLFVYHGIGAADNIWKVALEHMRDNGGQISSPNIAGEEATNLASGILTVRVAQKVMIEQMGADVPGYTMDWVDSPDEMDDSGYWLFQFYPGDGLSLKPRDMGHVKLPCGAWNTALCDARKSATMTLISDMEGPASDLASFHSEGANSPPSQDAFKAAVARYQGTLSAAENEIAQEANDGYQEGLDEFVRVATLKGWAHAGSWYWTIAKYNEEAHGGAKDVPTPPVINAGELIRATDGKLETYLAINDRYREVSTNEMEDLANGPGNWWNHINLFQLGNPAEWLASGDPVLRLQAIGNGILGVAATGVTAYVIGASSVKAANAAVDGGGIWTTIASTTGVVAKAKLALGFAIGFFEAAAPYMVGITLALVSLGFTLAYYLPSIPFVLWAMGVIGWVIIVIETLVAAPLWAAAHAIPEGEGIAGQHGRQGYMLFMGVLFRPCLMVIGFFMSTLILTALGKFIGSGFQTFASGMRAGTWGIGGIITWISLMFLMGGIIVTASHRLFGLITWIPDNVMKWIGHSPHALGEQDAEGRVRAGFGGFTSALQNSARPRGMGLRQPKPTPGGGGGGDKPAADKKNDDLSPGKQPGTPDL